MKKYLFCFFTVLTILVFPGLAQHSTDHLFPSRSFKTKAAIHIKKLADIGIRPAGSENEKKAALYIKNQFEAIGLESKIEDFQFETFELSRSSIRLGENHYEPELIGFDPYDKKMNFSGSAYLYDPSAEISADAVKNKTVVTTSPANYFKLMSLSPETIVYLNQEDFNKAKGGVGDFALKIEGKFIKEMSGNVSAVLYTPYETKKEIILTAHYDSYRTSPGANDNATGVAALIELARLFYQHMEKLTYNLRFVVFGCEEVGLLGSRMYLDRHAEDLRNCILVFNIDTVGGDSEIYAEMLGGMSAKYLEQRTNQFPKYLMDKAWDSKSGKWMILKPELLAPLFTASMVPQHLKEILETTGRELKIKINPAKGLFSDQRTFAQVGIPSTGLAQKTGSKIIHSPNDTPENVNINLVEKAAKICFSVVLKMMPDKTN